jgi:hypothetical protein
MKVFITFLLLLSSKFTFTQNIVFIGEKSYPSTETWNFNNVDINIGRMNSSSAFIMISTREDDYIKETISGSLIIYLKNGKQIILTNKIATDHLDNNTSAVYTINSTNLNLLKSSNINIIRYSINNEYGKRKSFTVKNETVRYSTMEVPVLGAESMSEIEKLQKNIQSRYVQQYLGSYPTGGHYDYYRVEQYVSERNSIETANQIKELYY